MTIHARKAAIWSLFQDWCTAAELQSLPAQPTTVAMFIDELSGGTTSRRTRIGVIREHHVRAHLGDPFPVLAKAPVAAPDPALGAVLANLVVDGWPAGLAGCRDGFLLVMFGGLHLSRRQIRALRPADIEIGPGKLTVLGRELERSDQPGTCAVCAVTRWLRMLKTVEVDSWYAVRMTLAGHRPERAADRLEHDCKAPIDRAWRRSSLLLPAIDRYGSVQLSGPIATRSITEVARKRADAAAFAAGPQTSPLPHRRVFELDPNRPAWTRAQTNAELAELDPVWDLLNAGTDDVASRLEALLAEYDR